MVENIIVHRDAGQSRTTAIRLALHELATPLVFSTITPVVVFLPLIAVTGVTGSFFRALAVTMTAALLTSLALAVTFTPALSLSLLGERGPAGRRARKTLFPFFSHGNAVDSPAVLEAEPSATAPLPPIPTIEAAHAGHMDGPVMRRVLSTHARALTWALNRPMALAAVCLVLVVATWFAYNALGSDLLPEMDEGAFILDYLTPAGTSLSETNRILQHVEQILRSTPEVEITSRRTGLQMGLAAVTEANTGDFTVRLKKDRDRDIDEVMEDVRDRIRKSEPALDIEFTQVLQDMIGDLSNSPEPIQIKLFSSDAALLNQLGPKVEDAIKTIPGVVDTQNGVDNTISGPATNFQIDPDVAARLGFTPSEVADDATAILDGLPATQPMIVNGRPYTIRVRLPEPARASLDSIQNTVFNSGSGHTASLGSLAQVSQLPPQNEILRENLQQLITVTGRLEGSDLGSAMQHVQATVQNLHIPSSVRIEYGGTYQEQQKSFHDLLRVLVLALVLVFGVLLAEFRNFSAPIAILTSSVLSISGVVLALLITRTDFNVASFMGLIMVIGIVAKNGILLLDADEKFRAQAVADQQTLGAPSIAASSRWVGEDNQTVPRDLAREAMLHAAQRRLRPIVMTAIAAVCGMLPLAFAIGSGSQMLQPLAIAVIGGLLVSVALSLIVTPAIYYRLTRSRHA
jgi:multidrug efflux pump subunit AcrB